MIWHDISERMNDISSNVHFLCIFIGYLFLFSIAANNVQNALVTFEAYASFLIMKWKFRIVSGESRL